jgi:hypothetical protein
VSKTARAVLAGVGLTLFSLPMSAQLIPHGNLYGGVSYGQFTEVVNKQSYRGWNGSAEAIPFPRLSHIGVVFDASGFYRTGVTQYNFLGGLRLSTTFGKWRPFVHGMGGIQRVNSSGILYNPPALDVGGGADYKLFFKNFSWRMQGDYMRTHYASANQTDYRASTGIVWRF